MKKIVLSIVLLTVGVAMAMAVGTKDEAPAASASAAPALSGTYTFGGSTTVAPIAYKALEAFQKEHPGVKISYEGVGSSTGLKQLQAGVYSLAGSSRHVKDSEKDAGVVPYAICLDGLTIVVNKDVNIASLTIDQLAKIYSGQISNWKEVGGADAPMVVLNRDETSGTFAAMKEMVLDPAKLKYRADALVAKENGEVAAKVASTPHSIGYIGMAFVEQVVSAGGKTVLIDGVEPNMANVINKSYPLSRNLFIATMGQPAEGTVEKAFVDFLLSPKGQAIVKSVDYIPLP